MPCHVNPGPGPSCCGSRVTKDVDLSARKNLILGSLLVLLIAAVIVLHGSRLDADVPTWFAPNDTGLHIDEGYKTLAPRNLALYGSTRWNPQDDYTGWMETSPLTQWPFYFAFQTRQVDALSARYVVLGYFSLLICGVGLFLFTRGRKLPAVLAVSLLGIDPVLFHFSRIAIFEIPIAAWVYLSIFLVLGINEKWPILRIIALAVATVIGLLTIKASMPLYVLPPILALSFVVLTHHIHSRLARIAGILLGVGGMALTAWMTFDIWDDRIAIVDYMGFISRLFLNPLTELTPIALTAGFLATFHGLVTDPGRFFKDPYRLILASIILGCPMLIAMFSYAPPRYYVAVVPACLLLLADWIGHRCWTWAPAGRLKFWQVVVAALIGTLALFFALRALDFALLTRLPIGMGSEPGISGIQMLNYLGWLMPFIACLIVLGRRHFVRPQVVAGFACLLVIVFFMASAINIGTSIFAPNNGSQTVRSNLMQAVQPGASIAGDWAPFFALGTDIPALYSNNQTNRVTRWDALRPDYFLDSGTRFDASTAMALEADHRFTLGEPVLLGIHVNNAIRLWPIQYLEPNESGPIHQK